MHLLGFGGKSVQLLQWIISLTTGTSVGGGGGTNPMPGIIGLIGVIPVIMLRLGSKPGTQIESVSIEHKILAYKSWNYLLNFSCIDSFPLSPLSLFVSQASLWELGQGEKEKWKRQRNREKRGRRREKGKGRGGGGWGGGSCILSEKK